MSVQDSTQFRNKSISQLVLQLNSLGQNQITLQQTNLIAIQDSQLPEIRRFRSKSTSRSVNVQMMSREREIQMKEFFLVDGSQKKYCYGEIVGELQTVVIGGVMGKFEQGFNTSFVMQWSTKRFKEVLLKIQPWLGVTSVDKNFCASFIQFKTKEAIDLLSGTSKSMTIIEACQKDQQFYELSLQQLLSLKNQSANTLKILRLSKLKHNNAQIRLVLLPQSFFTPLIQDPSLKIVKSQLTQIITYIKTNPNKKYENINKLLPKRFPVTTAIAQILLYDSANYVFNWVCDGRENKNCVNGRFQFYDRLSGICNLMKKVEGDNRKGNLVKIKKMNFKSPKLSKQTLNENQLETKNLQTSQTLQKTDYKNVNEIQYCRSLQRKTHKYSISQFEDQNSKLFPDTVPLYPNISPQLDESQAIVILKAQHAREVSQYHQTIQNLNQKILVLTSENGMSQLFTIHEREIMLLQLKISELRKDISKICSAPTKQKQTQNLKEIIKKLNEELSGHQKANPSHKLSQGKIKILQSQLSEWKDKYKKSEIARKQLKYELEAATNRLKIKDAQTQKLMEKEQKIYRQEDISAKQLAVMAEMEELAKSAVNKDSAKYICSKFRSALGNMSELRETVLECHNFLVDLQEHIQSRLSEKDPDVVLDCNRFIRTYLLNNLNIF